MSEPQAAFNIQRVYLKDQSLEIPHAPLIFLEQGSPNVEIQLTVEHEKLQDELYEVAMTSTVTTKVGEKVAFLVEAKQAGIFQITGVPADQMDPLLGIVCPSIIYPYLRANVADLIQRAGFPPIHLQEINFEAFYQQRQQEAQAAASNGQALN